MFILRKWKMLQGILILLLWREDMKRGMFWFNMKKGVSKFDEYDVMKIWICSQFLNFGSSQIISELIPSVSRYLSFFVCLVSFCLSVSPSHVQEMFI